MANSNLFYSLYSTSNDTITTNYKCNSAIDEHDTSFDISGSDGVITDSNGNTLSTISLADIHIDNLTQYNTETRIIQPHSCYLLQGQEYGYALSSFYYCIPENIFNTVGYEKYCNISFDIYCDNIEGNSFHVLEEINGVDDITEIINEDLANHNIKVITSFQSITDNDNITRDYLVFTAQEETFFYYIKNLFLDCVDMSEDFPYSPFNHFIDNIKLEISELLYKYHPLKKDEVYDEETYEPDCDLYKWLILNYTELLNSIDNYHKALSLLDSINEETTENEIDNIIINANILLADTPYNDEVLEQYELDNMFVILNILEELQIIVESQKPIEHIWLKEDILKRIPMMKYVNGAFKGIVLIPDYPKTDEYEYQSLWINHIQDTVNLYEEIEQEDKQILYKKHEVGVLSTAMLATEKKVCTCTYNIQGISTNSSIINNIPNGFEDDCETIEVDDKYPNNDGTVNTQIFMGETYYSKKEDIIGLYRYLQHITEEHLWNRCGAGYMVLAGIDNMQSKELNLPTSLLIYNPNDIPIRIKYMIFS